jgi:CubicO group peptidase (beta-lactamase class C family)
MTTPDTIAIHGRCDARFERVREAFRANFADGSDVGASCAVTVDGDFAVDLWAGWADAAQTLPWQRDTIVNVYSTTKTMTALAALVLADRGEIDLAAPVARYWPEFAQNGKAAVEVRHLLGHTAGLSGLDTPVAVEDLYDWERITQLLARQAPWWPPGSQSGYHALTQGYLVGEVVRRVSGMTLGAFFRTEIAEPLGADFHIGLAARHDSRVGELIPPPDGSAPLTSAEPGSIAARTFASPAIDALASRTTAWRRAEIPAANGHGNARSIATVQSVVANGGMLSGQRILSARGCQRIFEEQANGTDLVLGLPIRFGMGYGLTSDAMPLGPNPHTCFWGGWGGSLVIVDTDTHVCIAYAMNRMGGGTVGDMRALSIASAVFASLEQSA